jgi:hypothetical protein|nr:MAG TPA: hypothetical protein [Caudoviricetes sp.]
MGVYIIINKTKSTKDKMVIKVGCSKNIDNRFKQIQRSFKFNGINDELVILTKIQCSNYKLLEKHLHTMLNSRRILDNHEWFAVDEEFLNERLMRIDLSYYK